MGPIVLWALAGPVAVTMVADGTMALLLLIGAHGMHPC